ncbi:MAG: hypothetical protein ABSH39_23670 [Candidatus Acidiferrum sp.]|jgi:hypothetical protein
MKLAYLTLATTLAFSHALVTQSSSDKSAAPATATPPSQQPVSDPFAGAPAAKPEDVKSIDSLMAALYDVISGPAGERDWNRFRSLFIPTAHLTSTSIAPDGSVRVHPSSPDDYAKAAGGYFLKNGFFEKPIVNRIETYGNVAQIFSSYESRHAAGDAPFARGINSIQMLNDGKRWWIVSVLWDSERANNPLPKEFATKP